MGYKVAVAGATGNVGREILNILHERSFPADEVIPLASEASIGKEVSYGDDDTLTVQALNHFDFKGTDLGLFSPGGAVSAEHAPRAAAAGCVVIDNTSHFRMDPEAWLSFFRHQLQQELLSSCQLQADFEAVVVWRYFQHKASGLYQVAVDRNS